MQPKFRIVYRPPSAQREPINPEGYDRVEDALAALEGLKQDVADPDSYRVVLVALDEQTTGGATTVTHITGDVVVTELDAIAAQRALSDGQGL